MRKALIIFCMLSFWLPCGASGLQERRDTLSELGKVDRENFFWEELHSFKSTRERTCPNNLQRISQFLYVSENGWFEVEAIRNTAFFKRVNNTYRPVCEAALPTESVMTLLTGYTAHKQYNIHLIQHRYGFTKVETDVPLSQLLDFCLDAGCLPYVGIVSAEGEEVMATLFMVNPDEGYCHTFRFTIEKALLDKDAGFLQAEAYTFTPINNLKQ